ncbi:MAG TPA: glycosyltransferase family 4 protein [Gammaproteobacteria bacterium]|nr:glycosyltransferase family 4 protein [Gammaproteobacteria bacterium]
MQFHVLSFEGPDAYSRAGGLASRADGLVRTLASLGFEAHLWFIGDPSLPGHETHGTLHLHRWAQWVSRHHPDGVYDGEWGKHEEYARTLPPYLVESALLPAVRHGQHAVVMAEEWHTVHTVMHLRWLLERAGIRDRVTVLWNANNTFGFDQIDWPSLQRSAVITTVSRYMKHHMAPLGVDALVVPNGLSAESFEPLPGGACAALRRHFRNRTVVVKMARWDPDKRWIAAVETVADMKRAGWRPLLLARGGAEPYEGEVFAAMAAHGLNRQDREWRRPGVEGVLEVLRDIDDGVDVVNLRSHVDPGARRLLFRGSDAVLANSSHEPFGLVGLEAMAAGGLACTGCTGEDYAMPGQNALVLETGEPKEFLGMFARLRAAPREARAMRRAGRLTARRFAWSAIVERVLLPRLELVSRPLNGVSDVSVI